MSTPHLPQDAALIQRLAGFSRLQSLLADVPKAGQAEALAALPLAQFQACFAGQALQDIALVQSCLKGVDWEGAFEREMYLCLCDGEARMVVAELQHPSRMAWQLHFNRYIHVTQRPVNLAELLQSETGRQRLSDRLSEMLPYDPVSYEQADAAVFWIDGGNVRQLLFRQDTLLPLAQPERDLPFELRWGHPLTVWSSQGLGGVMGAGGHFGVPCQYAYLSDPHGGLVEASCLPLPPVQPPVSHGDYLRYRCDILDCATGQTVNPPQHPALQGSLDISDGVFVALAEPTNAGSQPLMGFMDRHGQWLGQPCWAEVMQFWERRAAVQCQQTRLWGFIDETGSVVVAPQYLHGQCFTNGTATLRTAQDPEHEVLIDRDGRCITGPWHDIRHGHNRTLVVQNDPLEWALLSPQGDTLVPFCTPPAELDDDHKAAHLYRLYQAQRQTLAATLGQGPLHERVKTLHIRTERDLHELGLWYRGVQVASLPSRWQDQIDLTQPARIGWDYPVSGSLFNLETEAPVIFGRTNGPSVTLGIPWADLTLLDE